MRKRDIVLDFTSLLDVIMILLFLVLGSMSQASKKGQEAISAELESMIEVNQQLSAENMNLYETIDGLNDALTEFENVQDHAGQNMGAILEFSNSKNIRIELKMIDRGSWQLRIHRGDEIKNSIPTGTPEEIALALSGILYQNGYEDDDTLLCEFIYDASEDGTLSASRIVKESLVQIKKQFIHLFYSEIHLNSFE